jgi:two-component system, OmpR family, sensor kinase
VNPLRSVGARLSLALLLAVAAALGLVYAAVAPSLENRLVDSRLNDLERSAPALAQEINTRQFVSASFYVRAATTTNSRVVLMKPLSRKPWTLNVLQDSQGDGGSGEVRDDPLASDTAKDFKPRSSTVSRGGERFAEVTVPVGNDGTVLLLSASLDRALNDVGLVKRRLLIAGGVVLALVFVLGYAGSWVFARRIRRLERAAERIADGMFDEPVTDPGKDEVGELARAFERMRRRLAQLDHARREFIANASHELRTPLFSLGGFLELLDDEDLDEDTRREFLTTMREQVQRLEKLATELLDLSRLDAGHIDLDREAVALDALARTAAEEFTAVALQSGHELEVTAPRPVLAIVDEQRTLQIARILVENAIVHTPSGTHVRIDVFEERGHARLTVSDDGPGIDEAEAASIFERFYRIDGAQASGSGLGLAIARELVRLMGGSLELERSDGRTSFVVTLAAAAAPTDSTAERLEATRT